MVNKKKPYICSWVVAIACAFIPAWGVKDYEFEHYLDSLPRFLATIQVEKMLASIC
ncbi:hypothetical protein [Peribacillus deserti]|uniref:hypothetical protein n=1 Tax=Peribacillus deserti TaxID=673318 RepID=UPI001C60EF84|nr:hypothetical protein [Peribacillus deserti]